MQKRYSTSTATERAKILIIYTGGTIGMKQDSATEALSPYNFEEILKEVPELKRIIHTIDVLSFTPPIDSSDVDPSVWIAIAQMIEQNYLSYDGFVVLHGTDTMSYTASALSFMLENLAKPVVLTGSQLPVGMLRTDGRENIVSAIEVAAARNSAGKAMVPEVTLFFGTKLYRGNRTTKYSAENFNAFHSPNYPSLAEAGITIKYNTPFINYPENYDAQLKVHKAFGDSIAILKLFPGISPGSVEAILEKGGAKGVIMESFGSGNATTKEWFISLIEKSIAKGMIILNVTQCMAGKVDMSAYSTGIELLKLGVIGGVDITFEAAVAKFLFLMGQTTNHQDINTYLKSNLRGEISIE